METTDDEAKILSRQLRQDMNINNILIQTDGSLTPKHLQHSAIATTPDGMPDHRTNTTVDIEQFYQQSFKKQKRKKPSPPKKVFPYQGKNQYKSLEKKGTRPSKSLDKKKYNTAREGIFLVSGSKKEMKNAKSARNKAMIKTTPRNATIEIKKTPRLCNTKKSGQSSIQRTKSTPQLSKKLSDSRKSFKEWRKSRSPVNSEFKEKIQEY